MYWYLTLLGKKVTVFNHDPLPHKFGFLTNAEALSMQKPKGRFDVLVVLDCSNPSRLGWNGHRDLCSHIVNIDHHRDNVLFGDINFVRKDGAATGQIIYDYFTNKNIAFPDMSPSRSTPRSSRTPADSAFQTPTARSCACAPICPTGARTARRSTKKCMPPSRKGLLLQAKIWSTLAFHLNGAVCSMEMPYRLIDELGATYGDSEGMADLTILADGVEVGVFLNTMNGRRISACVQKAASTWAGSPRAFRAGEGTRAQPGAP